MNDSREATLFEKAYHLARRQCCSNRFVLFCVDLSFPPGVSVGILNLIVSIPYYSSQGTLNVIFWC